MNTRFIIEQLAHNHPVFLRMLSGVSAELYHWKPNQDKWSILEVVCHLRDEEVEDFRTRVRCTLERPDLPPPPIDPGAWVEERNYRKQNYEEVVASWLKEREASVKWLRSLESPNWDHAFMHPKLGPRSAGMYLANWLAHDYIHIRQINRLKYEYFDSLSDPSLEYAGNW